MPAVSETEIERIVVRVTADTQQYERSVQRAQQTTRRFAQTAKKESEAVQVFGKTIGELGNSFGGMAGSILGLAALRHPMEQFKSAINLAAEAEMTEAAFSTMLGSVEKGHQLIADMQRFAAETPLTMPGLEQAAKMLLQFDVAAKDIIPTMKMLGDVAQGDQQRLMRLALAFGQIKSIGRVMGDELMQMREAGFNPLQEIARTTGKTIQEVNALKEQGLITFDDIRGAFESATSAGGKFNDGMKTASQTFKGLTSTMEDDIGALMRAVGKDVIVLFRLKEAVQGVSAGAKGLTSWFSELSSWVKILVAGLALLVAGMGILVVGWKIGATVIAMVVTNFANMVATGKMARTAIAANTAAMAAYVAPTLAASRAQAALNAQLVATSAISKTGMVLGGGGSAIGGARGGGGAIIVPGALGGGSAIQKLGGKGGSAIQGAQGASRLGPLGTIAVAGLATYAAGQIAGALGAGQEKFQEYTAAVNEAQDASLRHALATQAETNAIRELVEEIPARDRLDAINRMLDVDIPGQALGDLAGARGKLEQLEGQLKSVTDEVNSYREGWKGVRSSLGSAVDWLMPEELETGIGRQRNLLEQQRVDLEQQRDLWKGLVKDLETEGEKLAKTGGKDPARASKQYSDFIKKSEEASRTLGKVGAAAELAKLDLDSMTYAQRRAVQGWAEFNEATEKAVESTKKAAEEKEKLAEKADELIRELDLEAKSIGKTKDQIDLLKIASEGYEVETFAVIVAMKAVNSELERMNNLVQDAAGVGAQVAEETVWDVIGARMEAAKGKADDLRHSVERLDLALAGSAEARARVFEFRRSINEQREDARKRAGFAPNSFVPAPIARSAFGPTGKDAAVDLLKDIKEILKAQADQVPIDIDPSDLRR